MHAWRGLPQGGLLLSRQVVGAHLTYRYTITCPLAALYALELVAHRKDPGLLIRESWVRIPPGAPGHRSDYLPVDAPVALLVGDGIVRLVAAVASPLASPRGRE